MEAYLPFAWRLWKRSPLASEGREAVEEEGNALRSGEFQRQSICGEEQCLNERT